MRPREVHVSAQIDSYLTGVLDSEDEQAYEVHLLECAVCRTEADAASAVAVALARLPRDAVEDFPAFADPPVPVDGGTLEISTSPDSAGTEVRAVAAGLHAGKAFELLAIGADGHNYLVARGIADDGPQTMTGVAPLPQHRIRFYAVVQDRDGVLLAAVGG